MSTLPLAIGYFFPPAEPGVVFDGQNNLSKRIFDKLIQKAACQKSLAEFAARRPRIRFDPFFAAAPPKGTSVGRVRREKYFALASAQRNWPRQTRRLMSGQSVFVGACAHGRAGRSEIPFVKKGRRPFLTSSRGADAVRSSYCSNSSYVTPRASRIPRSCVA